MGPSSLREGRETSLPPFQTRQGEILPGEIVSSGSSQRAWLARLVRPPPVHVVVGKSPPLLLVFPWILGEHENLRALYVLVGGEPPGEGVEGAPAARGGAWGGASPLPGHLGLSFFERGIHVPRCAALSAMARGVGPLLEYTVVTIAKAYKDGRLGILVGLGLFDIRLHHFDNRR